MNGMVLFHTPILWMMESHCGASHLVSDVTPLNFRVSSFFSLSLRGLFCTVDFESVCHHQPTQREETHLHENSSARIQHATNRTKKAATITMKTARRRRRPSQGRRLQQVR
jgi:hypothetical protein